MATSPDPDLPFGVAWLSLRLHREVGASADDHLSIADELSGTRIEVDGWDRALATAWRRLAGEPAIDDWVEAYARWWAGSEEDLVRPEVSPALADLSGLPRALMLHGTRDLLHPGCRLLARRAAEAGWDLTSIEEPDLIHVYGLLPFTPESRRAFRQVVEFLR